MLFAPRIKISLPACFGKRLNNGKKDPAGMVPAGFLYLFYIAYQLRKILALLFA